MEASAFCDRRIKTGMWEPWIRQSPGAPLSWNGSRSSVFSVCSLCSVDGISPSTHNALFPFTSNNPLVLAFGCFFSMLLLHPHSCWWLQAAITCFFSFISSIPWVYSEHTPSKIQRQWPLDTTCTFLCQLKPPPLFFSAACFCFSNIIEKNNNNWLSLLLTPTPHTHTHTPPDKILHFHLPLLEAVWIKPPWLDQFTNVTLTHCHLPSCKKARRARPACEKPVASMGHVTPRKQKEADIPSYQRMLAKLPLPRNHLKTLPQPRVLEVPHKAGLWGKGISFVKELWLCGVFVAGEADRVPGLCQHAADECPDTGEGALQHASPQWHLPHQSHQAFHHGEWWIQKQQLLTGQMLPAISPEGQEGADSRNLQNSPPFPLQVYMMLLIKWKRKNSERWALIPHSRPGEPGSREQVLPYHCVNRGSSWVMYRKCQCNIPKGSEYCRFF